MIQIAPAVERSVRRTCLSGLREERGYGVSTSNVQNLIFIVIS